MGRDGAVLGAGALNMPMNLPEDLLRRSFVATNGERAFPPEDIEAVLDAYSAAGIPVYGWELWIIDHDIAPGAEPKLVPMPGRWCGLLPTAHGTAVAGGWATQVPEESDTLFARRAFMETREQLRSVCAGTWVEVAAAWRPYLRINLTI